MIRERAERRLVAGQPHVNRRGVRIGPLPESEARVRVGAGEADHSSLSSASASHVRSTLSGRSSSVAIDCGARSRYVSSARAIGRRGSSRHSLSALIHSRPSIGASQSCQLSDGRGDPGCAANAESAKAMHILDDVFGRAGNRIRRRRQADRRVVAAGGVQLDAVDRQHAAAIRRRIGRARAVAVIGQDDELQAARAAAAAIASTLPLPSERLE